MASRSTTAPSQRTSVPVAGGMLRALFNLVPQPSLADLGDAISGFEVAFTGAKRALGNPDFRSAVKELLPTFGVSLVALYAALAVAAVVLGPLVLVMLFISPGTLLSVLTGVPHWAYEFAASRAPQVVDRIFISSVGDRAKAEQLKEQLGRNAYDISGRSRKRFARLRYFFRQSALYSVLSFIPVIGPIISTLGSLATTAETLGQGVLESYLTSKGLHGAARRDYFNKHRWAIYGFCLPYVITNAIPILGSLAPAIAQGSAGDFIQQVLEQGGQQADKPAAGTAAVSDTSKQSAGEQEPSVPRVEDYKADPLQRVSTFVMEAVSSGIEVIKLLRQVRLDNLQPGQLVQAGLALLRGNTSDSFDYLCEAIGIPREQIEQAAAAGAASSRSGDTSSSRQEQQAEQTTSEINKPRSSTTSSSMKGKGLYAGVGGQSAVSSTDGRMEADMNDALRQAAGITSKTE